MLSTSSVSLEVDSQTVTYKKALLQAKLAVLHVNHPIKKLIQVAEIMNLREGILMEMHKISEGPKALIHYQFRKKGGWLAIK